VLDPLTVSARFSTTDMTYVINENLEIGGNPGGALDDGTGHQISRLAARLAIDPGVIVKLGGARIETQIGSQFISRFLEINGNGGLHIDYDPNQAIPRRILGLVE
jgi:hypothetical protein